MKMTFSGVLVVSAVLGLLAVSVTGAVTSNSIWAWSAGIVYVIYDTWLLLYVAWRTRKLHQTTTQHTHIPSADYQLSVIIPARNEASGIVATVEKVLAQDSAATQIIVVNDGSTDDTVTQLNQRYRFEREPNSKLYRSANYPQLQLVDKTNSGKADSMNQALKHITGDWVLTLDADTLLAPDAITQLLVEFDKDPDIGVCCGIIQPTTHGGWLAKILESFQQFEYLRGFLARAAWARSDALLLVSGAFAAYKTELLRKVGGFSCNSKVEDYELIHRMYRYAFEHDEHWRVTICNHAKATTDAPANAQAFINQRKRWFAGFLETQFQYRQMIGNRRYGNVGGFMLPIKTVDTVQPILGLISLVLIPYLALTNQPVALQLGLLIAIKLSIDCIYYFWAVYHYHRWINAPIKGQQWFKALACCLFEPLLFQPLRHFSAFRGWLHLLNNQSGWNPSRSANKLLKDTP